MNALPERPTPRILNVDDNDGARYVKSRVLRLAGFEVIDATTGQEALDRALSMQPDLVVLDVKLPDINGLDVCRRLKADLATRSILVLQTSAAFVDSAHRVKALDAGADSYLVEPIEPDELVANVNALLRLRRAEEGHRTAQLALSESEERFRQLAENISDVFWIVSADDLRFLYVSPAYASQWGRDAGALLADPAVWFERIHAEDRERMRARFLAMAGAEAGYDDEYRVSGARGDERWASERAFPVFDETGKVYRFAGITQDVTQRKNSDLMLREADRRKDEFLAMLSHELRNPLAPIRSAVDLMVAAESQPAIRARAVEILGRQVGHLSRLVEDLLDVSRINQGKISLTLRPVDLRDVLEAAVETVRPLVTARLHTLRLEVDDVPMAVDGDPVRLAQLFGNLLHNSAKYTLSGGHIVLAARVLGDQVEVAVTDDGVGIAADVLPRVFDLFTQADQALDRSQGGLGIGLSLVRRIVELHGGEVFAESAGLGHGSRFAVRLPRLAAEVTRQSAGAAAAAAPAAAVHARSVLIVDDNADTVEALALLLRSHGHEVHTAADGAAAIERVRLRVPHVVLLDIGLPGMTGYDVARELRALPLSPAPLLVAVSGYGREADREASRAAGFDHHLVKPADPKLLLELLAG